MPAPGTMAHGMKPVAAPRKASIRKIVSSPRQPGAYPRTITFKAAARKRSTRKGV